MEYFCKDEEYVQRCLAGELLFGDDFDINAVNKWFEVEGQAYANLYGKREEDTGYDTHQLNIMHGFRFLPKRKFDHVLSVGGAFGDELLPLISQIDKITILEPGTKFIDHHLPGKDVRYVRPDPSGIMPFQDNSFDLICCFSALHHIPNVSTVVQEMRKKLMPGGFVIIREPTTSMGNWREPRTGLTAYERGISSKKMISILQDSGLQLVKRTFCDFAPLRRVAAKIGFSPYKSAIMTRIDAFFSLLFKDNNVYYPQSFWNKIRPGAAVYVCTKKDE